MREKTILNKIKKGDQSALDSLIHELYPHVYSFVYRKMQGDDIAKDITQVTFLRFIQQIPLYQAQGKILHYLYRIASNLCHDVYRKQKREVHDDIDTKSIQGNDDVHETILNQIQKEALLLYIQQLSENQQDIILLKYFHQMTFKEISESFSVPISTLKTRHTAALKKLTRLWKEGENNE